MGAIMTTATRGIGWQPHEDALLLANYGTMTRAQIGALLGRSMESVGSRLATLGVTRRTLVALQQARAVSDDERARDHAARAEANHLAVLVAYRLAAISAAQAAVVLGVPVERLPVELGRAAARGLDVVQQALSEDA
jgi:DNA-directed RNA polymerase specialized sigma24 family protein